VAALAGPRGSEASDSWLAAAPISTWSPLGVVSMTTPLASIQPEMGAGVVGAEDGGIVAADFLNVGVGVDAEPGAAFFRDYHFAANLHAIDFLGTRVGRDVERVTRRAVARGPAMGFSRSDFFFWAKAGRAAERKRAKVRDATMQISSRKP